MSVIAILLDLISTALLRLAMASSCACCRWASTMHWRREALRRRSQRWWE